MLVSLLLTSLAAGSLTPTTLRCEALVDPVGIHTGAPRLSWKLQAAQAHSYNLSQSGYRITVGSSPEKADLWDTGKVRSAETFNIQYKGKPLASGQKVWWRVQVFDQKGAASFWSKPATWSVGLLKPSDWKAEWIGYDEPLEQGRRTDPFNNASWIWGPGEKSTVYLRRTFNIKPGLKMAVVHVSVDDQFTLKINGKQVLQSSGKADAWRQPLNREVTEQLKAGENVIEIRAENGAGFAGAVLNLFLLFPERESLNLQTDEFWEAGDEEAGPFKPVKVLGKYGMDPWNKFSAFGPELHPPRLLRKEFSLSKPVKRATLYGSALGLLEMRLNGKRVGNEYFMPGWTDYAKRVHSRGYDVTNQVSQGKNALGVILGDGWYSGYVGYGGRRNHYGAKTRALVQLVVEHTDGTKEIIGTDPSWKASTGPILHSDFLMGEAYNSTLEKTGWDKSGYQASGWKQVDTGAEMKPAVEPFPGQPVRAFAVLKPKKITEPQPKVYVLDLGQNIAGFARLKIKGKNTMKVVLRFAERLNPDGTIYTTNLRGARATDIYLSRGDELETWEPRFTFHGFQYIEVTGIDHKPTADEVVGVALSSDTPDTGKIVTSDSMINKLVQNAWWTQRANFIDVPTDCPQRDERLGWTGDAQAYIRTAAMLTDVQPFFTKWLVSLDDAQRADGQYPMVAPLKVAEGDGGPAWADAGVICPWVTYDVYGDKELLARHYPQMKKFIEFCVKRSTPDLLPPKQFHCFGDWLNINDNTPNEVIYTAYFAGSSRILAQAAAELGKKAEHDKYMDLYRRVRAAFQKEYVSADGVVRSGSQCAYVLALAFDLMPDSKEQLAADHLVANIEKRGWHLSTGFVGTRDIMHVLSKVGRNDVAFRLLHNKTFPSWGFTIVNGATSIWERWDGWTPEKGFQDPGMNSFAHYAFGAVVGWMFDQPAGIRNLTPGFRKVRIAPQIDPNLTWLKSSYDSINGKIVSEWSVKGSKLTMKVVVPANMRASIVVPATNVLSQQKIASKNGVFEVGSGEYLFTGDVKK